MTPLIAEMVKLCPGADDYHWFDLSGAYQEGRMVNMDVLDHNPLPFEKCALACEQGDMFALVLLQQIGNAVGYRAWTIYSDGTRIKHPLLNYVRTGNGIEVHQMDEKKVESELCRELLAAVANFLELVNRNAITCAKPVPRKSFINSKRAAKGLGPILFDWHTVTIQPARTKAEPKGGTHASPRLHDRRGHWRSLSSGKQVWVRNCKVGDASKGVVFKDYKVAQ